MPICPEAISHCYHIQAGAAPPSAICCWCSSQLIVQIEKTGENATREWLAYFPAPKPVSFHGQMHQTKEG